MKLIETLRAKLASLGGTLDDSGGYSLHFDAPKGYVWRSNDEATLSIHYATNRQSWLCEAVKVETPNIRMGLEKVKDPARLAEIQFLKEDDSWKAEEGAPDRLEWPK